MTYYLCSRPSDQVTGSTESGPPYQKPRVNGKETTKEKTKNGDEKAKDFRCKENFNQLLVSFALIDVYRENA